MKTVKQIADEIGVSKQAVHQKRKKEPLSTRLRPFTSTVDGIVYIDVDGEKLIREAFVKTDPTTVDGSIYSVDVNAFTPVDGVCDNTFTPVDSQNNIEYLQKELDAKNGLIAQLQDNLKDIQSELKVEREHSRQQSDKLTNLLEQVVELQRNNQLLEGHRMGLQAITDGTANDSNFKTVEQPPDESKKSLFTWWKKKK